MIFSCSDIESIVKVACCSDSTSGPHSLQDPMENDDDKGKKEKQPLHVASQARQEPWTDKSRITSLNYSEETRIVDTCLFLVIIFKTFYCFKTTKMTKAVSSNTLSVHNKFYF